VAFDGWDLVVGMARDADEHDSADLVRRLRAELLDLDVEAVEPMSAEAVPQGAKSLSGIAGMVAVRLGSAGLKAVFVKIRDWAIRNNRTVEVTIDGDTIKLTAVSDQLQERLINAWLTRHAPGV